jgi:hypothetical protein
MRNSRSSVQPIFSQASLISPQSSAAHSVIGKFPTAIPGFLRGQIFGVGVLSVGTQFAHDPFKNIRTKAQAHSKQSLPLVAQKWYPVINVLIMRVLNIKRRQRFRF